MQSGARCIAKGVSDLQRRAMCVDLPDSSRVDAVHSDGPSLRFVAAHGVRPIPILFEFYLHPAHGADPPEKM